jgi:hypothetical protein
MRSQVMSIRTHWTSDFTVYAGSAAELRDVLNLVAVGEEIDEDQSYLVLFDEGNCEAWIVEGSPSEINAKAGAIAKAANLALWRYFERKFGQAVE